MSNKPTKPNYYLMKVANDQNEHPSLEEIPGILLSRNLGKQNVSAMEGYNKLLFTISLNNGKIVLSTRHSLDPKPPPTSADPAHGSYRCVMIKSNSASPIPLEFNPNEWFSYRETFQAEVPNFKAICDEETKLGWTKLHDNKIVTKKTVTMKKVQIIPPILVTSFLEAPNNLPETILSHFLDTIERETDIDADKIPTSIEDKKNLHCLRSNQCGPVIALTCSREDVHVIILA